MSVRLVCPLTRQPLRPGRNSGTSVLQRADGRGAYPIADDVPVLLGPELLTDYADERPRPDGIYAEAYDEMKYYNAVARDWAAALDERAADTADGGGDRNSDDPVDQALRLIEVSRRLDTALVRDFPEPADVWIHLRFEGEALADAYRHLAPFDHKRILQIGGLGLDAAKFLLAGAAEVWLLSPMLQELEFAVRLARHCGVEARLQRVAGVAEELPFEDETFDGIYAGGSVHHMVVSQGLSECARVLRPGGRFAAVEPWRAPGYRLGTRLMGKREPVHCMPLTKERVAPLHDVFDRARVIHHGALTRYAAIGLARLGSPLPTRTVRSLTQLDDALTSRVPFVRDTGSSVALLASRA